MMILSALANWPAIEWRDAFRGMIREGASRSGGVDGAANRRNA